MLVGICSRRFGLESIISSKEQRGTFPCLTFWYNQIILNQDAQAILRLPFSERLADIPHDHVLNSRLSKLSYGPLTPPSRAVPASPFRVALDHRCGRAVSVNCVSRGGSGHRKKRLLLGSGRHQMSPRPPVGLTSPTRPPVFPMRPFLVLPFLGTGTGSTLLVAHVTND